MKYGIISICISLAFVAGCLSGIENPKEMQAPEIIRLWNEPPQTVILTNGSGAALPLFAPIVANSKIRIDVNSTENAIDASNISLFSSRLAITFWNESDEAIVVDSYKNALISSPIAYMKNIPILVYGETTETALKMLGCNEVIAVGNVPVKGNVVLGNDSQVYSYVIQTSNGYGINLNYVTLVNSNDRNSSCPYLSGVGSLLNAYRHGIIVDVTNGFFKKLYVKPNEFSAIQDNLTRIFAMLNESGMKVEYVCIVARPDDIPYVNLGEMVSGAGDTLSDNYYGHKKTKKKVWSVPDFAAGRFMSSTLKNATILLERIMEYQVYLLADQNFGAPHWQNRALVIADDQMDAVAATSTTDFIKSFLIEGKFTVAVVETQAGKYLIQDLVNNSNFIYALFLIYSGAGSETTPKNYKHPVILATVTTGDMEPDSRSKQDNFIQNTVDSGVVAFLVNSGAGMAGMGRNWIPIAPSQMNYIQLLFYTNLIEKNVTIGTALLEAKKQFFNENSIETDNVDTLSITGLTLYGDPAFNPYEPCNEGSQ